MNSNVANKTSAISNFFWRFFERCGAQAVTLIVSIILARVLTPSIYGTIALVTVFTTILQVFVDSGLGSALIQKKDADDLDFSTVFYFNLLVSVLLYICIFFIAPFISDFYKITELTAVIRSLSLTIIIAGARNIQQAYISKHLIFKKFFFATLTGTIIAATIGIWMAYNNYGVWALVTQHLSNTLVGTVMLWFSVKWRPKWIFSLKRLKVLFSYGWKLLVSGLLETIYNNLRSLIIGKLYTKEDLAFYDRGIIFPKAIASNISSSLDSVLFPTMSSVQDNTEKVKSMTRRSISISTYIIAPCVFGLSACAEPVISLILTDKWLDSVFYLRIVCITYCFYTIHTANLNAIKALGRSDLFLKLEIIKKIVGLIALFATVPISVKAMTISSLFTSFASQIINSWPNKKLLKYGYLEQLKDIMPSVILALIMGIIVYSISLLNLNLNLYFQLTIQILTGIIIYIVGSFLFQIESFLYLVNLLKQILAK